MGRRGSKVVKTGPHGMLITLFSAALLTLMMLLAIPAEAQNTNASTQYSSKETAQAVQGNGQQAQADAGKDDSQAAARAADSLTNEPAEITEVSDDGDATIANRIVVSGVDCTVNEGATATVRDADDTQVVLTDNDNVNITQEQSRIIIVGTDEDGNLDGVSASGEFGPSNNTETGRVVSSTGIPCGREADGDDGDGDDGARGDAGDVDDARTANELQNLSCEELLVLFRAGGGSSGQYGDAAALADSDVQARIEVCLEEEIVEGTAADGDLPDTGGVSLVGLAVLGLVSAAAGFSVIRGGRRRG